MTQMEGILKMYNVGQDTKFELGGDKETSYMYELGFAPQYHGACDAWADEIKDTLSTHTAVPTGPSRVRTADPSPQSPVPSRACTASAACT